MIKITKIKLKEHYKQHLKEEDDVIKKLLFDLLCTENSWIDKEPKFKNCDVIFYQNKNKICHIGFESLWKTYRDKIKNTTEYDVAISKFKNRFRVAIEGIIMEKRDVFNNDICHICNKEIIGDFHVDHDVVEFDEIFSKFMEKYCSNKESFITFTKKFDHKLGILPEKYTNEIIKFHNESGTVLKYTHKTCNLKKGKK